MIILFLIPFLLICSSASAKITSNGLMHFNYIGINNNQSPNQGLSSNSHINILLESENKNKTSYGIKAGLYQYYNGVGAGKASGIGRLFGFIENQYGEFNIGNNFSTSHILQANNFMISEYDGITNFILGLRQDDNQNYIYIPGLLTTQLRTAYQYISGANLSNKITYISPIINNFIFGFSYIPNNNDFIAFYDKGINTKPPSIRNISQFGITYRNQFDGTGVKVSFAIENGDIIQDNNDSKYRNAFTSWDVGAHISYMGFGLGLSHGENYSKSNNIYYNNGQYWLGGISYNIGAYSISISQMHSKNGGNSIRKNSGYIAYKMLKNMILYTEIAHFDISNKLRKNSDHIDALLLGMKLQF